MQNNEIDKINTGLFFFYLTSKNVTLQQTIFIQKLFSDLKFCLKNW